MTELPPLNQTRIVEVDGEERLAFDFARQDGNPVAVVGVYAVPCTVCGKPAGEECPGPAHFPRYMAMNIELERLRRKRDAVQ